MNLGFSTRWPNGTPTNFASKIWCSLIDVYPTAPYVFDDYYKRCAEMQSIGYTATLALPAKPHTLREDPNDRWHAGMDIHFVIHNRTKNRFQFAPVIKCVSVQEIYMTYFCGRLEISVDDKYLYRYDIEKIIVNDGFDSEETFIKWFFPYDQNKWSGKIIHWTDLKY